MKIKALRLKAGLSQIELSRIMGVAQPTVSDWESEKISPSSDKLPKLTKVLNCTLDDLYEKED